MSQTQPNTNQNKPSTPTIGAAAAVAAAATTANGKPTEPVAPATPAAATDAETTPSPRSRKVYVVTGPIHEFDSTAKAEKFLNSAGSPTEYTVLKGSKVGTSKKVSLR